jgi:hypothetical protein
MSNQTRSPPRVRLLAAALSFALPTMLTVSAAAGAPNNSNAPQQPHALDLGGLRAALTNYVVPAPKSKAPQRAPMTRAITNVADAGSGSLRDALANAVDGDVIDLSKLHGHILLSSALETTAAVTITGPGRDLLTLDGGGLGRVLQSAHDLTLSKVTITNGSVTASAPTPPAGGCLLVSGTLNLSNATVTNCHVTATGTYYGFGGAIAVTGTPGALILENDTITNSSATSGVEAVGGGVVASYATMTNTTISGNAVVQEYGTTKTNTAAGGGIAALSGPSAVGVPYVSVYAINSTISGNSATASGGSYYDPIAMTTTVEYGTAAGGAMFAGQGVYSVGITANGNSLMANGDSLGGGAILGGKSYVTLSAFSQNTATSTGTIAPKSAVIPFFTSGGGVLTAGKLTATRSAFNDNQVSSACHTCTVSGGGIASYSGSVSVIGSTIRGNSLTTTGAKAIPAGGGIGVTYSSTATPSTATVTNSTITGNTLTGAYAGHSNGAGVWIGGNFTLNNSTVAFNTSDGIGGGVSASYSKTTPFTNTFYSSIVANNSASDATTADVSSAGTQIIAGSNNLVMAAGVNLALPGDTIASDPMLKPLALNGGPTQTLALDPASPAIDAGAAPVSLIYDQRWTDFPRVIGTKPDIGAFELDTDHIFYFGFEYPVLP